MLVLQHSTSSACFSFHAFGARHWQTGSMSKLLWPCGGTVAAGRRPQVCAAAEQELEWFLFVQQLCLSSESDVIGHGFDYPASLRLPLLKKHSQRQVRKHNDRLHVTVAGSHQVTKTVPRMPRKSSGFLWLPVDRSVVCILLAVQSGSVGRM